MFASKIDYFETPDGIEIKELLLAMNSSDEYVTVDSYNPNSQMYALNAISFVEKHMEYIRKHPNLSATQYVSNLKIISRKR